MVRINLGKVKGDKGDTGARGATGPIGPIGGIGPQGVKGDIGPKGDTGAKGDTGMRGPAGSDATATKASIGLGNVDNVKQMPISSGKLENYTEKLVSTAGNINLALGNVFKLTPLSPTTITITNTTATGNSQSFTLIVEMRGMNPITFPSNVKWSNGQIPDLMKTYKFFVLTFLTIDGGNSWYGMSGGEF